MKSIGEHTVAQIISKFFVRSATQQNLKRRIPNVVSSTKEMKSTSSSEVQSTPVKSPRERAELVATEFRTRLIAGGHPNIVDMVEEAIKDFIHQQEQPPSCPHHPNYKGHRRPRTHCPECWKVYLHGKSY